MANAVDISARSAFLARMDCTVSPHRQHRKSAGERIAPIAGIANVGAGRLPDGRVAFGHSGAGAGPDLG
jgi:hypothetical protein